MTPHSPKPKVIKRPLDPFRRAVLRGLGVLLPPLLTIVIFLWVGNTVINYLLEPMEDFTRWALVEYTADIRPVSKTPEEIVTKVAESSEYLIEGELYVLTDDRKYIPANVARTVREAPKSGPTPAKARDIYLAYMDEQYLQRQYVIPVFLGVFILILYLLGKFLAAGVGRILWGQFERLIRRLPLVSNVYTSVKQVTDFMFSEPQLEATRVVAIEYPRRGIWTLAMVTGESMLDIRAAANEPVLSVLIPTSPMPFTGFTITVKKSETIDLDITIDQALQFIVSCGVVVAPHQLASVMDKQEQLVTGNSSTKSPSNVTGNSSHPGRVAPGVTTDE